MIAWAAAAFVALIAALGAQQRPFHFVHDVQPWLARAGCAAADCHGGATGRGGLRLSLFGSDPRADWLALTVDREARRIDLREPEHSLLLRKPTLDLEHGGGARLVRGGRAWRSLRDWIEARARFGDGAATIDALALTIVDGRARVRARYSWRDPHGGALRHADEDVSDRAIFTSTATSVVEVDAAGQILFHGAGDASLLARFAGRDAWLRIVRPFAPPRAPAAARSAVDRAWLAGLAELGLDPAAEASPDTLARRLWLDLAGRLPTPQEHRAFVALPAAARVATTVDRLLADDAFDAVAATWLARCFELPDDASRGLRAEIDALAAPGSLLDAVAARVDRPLIERLPDPRDRAELFGRAVLGLRLGCARCHDHPLDRWTDDEHLAFSAMFVDDRPAADRGATAGRLFDPRTGDAVEPALLSPLGSGVMPVADALRRSPLLFARNIANRVVAELHGRGLVEPVDDHRPTNPGVHPALLDALATVFVDEDFELRALVRAIATSRWYAVGGAPRELPEDPAIDDARRRYLAYREPRAMSDALHRAAVAAALTVPRDAATPLARSPLALWLARSNGPALRATIDADGSAIEWIAELAADDGECVDRLFELLLTRAPTLAERQHFVAEVGRQPDRLAALRDLAHAIVLSREFTSIR